MNTAPWIPTHDRIQRRRAQVRYDEHEKARDAAADRWVETHCAELHAEDLYNSSFLICGELTGHDGPHRDHADRRRTWTDTFTDHSSPDRCRCAERAEGQLTPLSPRTQASAAGDAAEAPNFPEK